MSEQELLDEIAFIKEFTKNCTPEQTKELMVKAGVINPDGTLTERYK